MNTQQIHDFMHSIQPIAIEGVFFTYAGGEAHLSDGMYCDRCLCVEDEGNCSCQEFEIQYNPDYTEEMRRRHVEMAQQININADELIVAAILVADYSQSLRQIKVGATTELDQQEIDFLAPLISQHDASYHDLMGIGLVMK